MTNNKFFFGLIIEISIFILIFILGCLLIYRSIADPKKIDAQILSFEIDTDRCKVGGRYFHYVDCYELFFNLSKTDKQYGIFLNQNEHGQDDLISKLDITKTYSFFIDPTVINFSKGKKLRINLIKDGENIIYQESSDKIIILISGSFMVMMSFVAFISIYEKRRKIVKSS